MLITADMVAQRRYARDANAAHSRTGLTIGPAVLRGLRDIGFRDTAAALAALVDNAIDAGAKRVDIVMDTEGATPFAIALIDNGYGMVPEMMRASCAVGVSCHLGEGPHLARNGFGLPSAPFAIGSRFDLLSCPHGAPLHGVTMDLDDIVSDEVPEARRAALPSFVGSYIATHLRSWSSGTMVVISGLDRVSPNGTTRLRTEITRHLGFVFGRFLARLDLRIDGERVQPIDPLFLLPGALNSSRWSSSESERFTVAIAGSEVTVRLSRLVSVTPPTLLREQRRSIDAATAFADQSDGLIVSRLERRLTVIPANPLFVFGPGDWRLRAEIDFPPALDELFAPALSLQQVHVADEVWRALRAAGVGRRLQSFRRNMRSDVTREQATDAPAAATNQASPRRRNRCLN